MPLWEQASFQRLRFHALEQFLAERLKEPQEVSLKLGSGFSVRHLPQLGGFAMPASFQE